MPTYHRLTLGEVKALITSQFPQWSELPLREVSSAGTDHELLRLGNDKLIRLPRVDWAAGQAEKEFRWLPVLAPGLPLTIPEPIAMGKATDFYPWNWSIYGWLEGNNAKLQPPSDLDETAEELAAFLKNLQSHEATTGPAAGRHNFRRGVPLLQLDEIVRRCVNELGKRINPDPILPLWEEALESPTCRKTTWVHGDLHAGNMLTQNGKLSAIIDFGGLGVGDPACDLIVAWNLLDTSSREIFRHAMHCDEGTWTRGRGWAIYTALVALPYYWDSNPSIVEDSWNTLSRLFPDTRIRG